MRVVDKPYRSSVPEIIIIQDNDVTAAVQPKPE